MPLNNNFDTVELITTLRIAPLNGAPSSREYNDSSREILTDLASLTDFVNQTVLPFLNSLPGSNPPSLDGDGIYAANPIDIAPLFQNSTDGSQLTIAQVLARLNIEIAQASVAVADMQARVLQLQTRLATTNQNDVQQAIQGFQALQQQQSNRITANEQQTAVLATQVATAQSTQLGYSFPLGIELGGTDSITPAAARASLRTAGLDDANIFTAEQTIKPAAGWSFLDLDTGVGGQQAGINFYDNGVLKWSLERLVNNTFALFDQANNRLSLFTDTAGLVHIGTTLIVAGDVNISGAINSSGALMAASLSLGTPLPIAYGGTNAATPAAARSALRAAGLDDANIFTAQQMIKPAVGHSWMLLDTTDVSVQSGFSLCETGTRMFEIFKQNDNTFHIYDLLRTHADILWTDLTGAMHIAPQLFIEGAFAVHGVAAANSLTLGSPLPISSGGTSAITAAAARANLVVDVAGTAATAAAAAQSTAQASSAQKSANLSDLSNVATARSNLQLTSAATAAPSALTETGSSVLTITGGGLALLGPTSIQVKQASASVSGYLSSTDWNTFNSQTSGPPLPLAITSGGTGVTSAAAALTALGAAGLGTNTFSGIQHFGSKASIDTTTGVASLSRFDICDPGVYTFVNILTDGPNLQSGFHLEDNNGGVWAIFKQINNDLIITCQVNGGYDILRAPVSGADSGCLQIPVPIRGNLGNWSSYTCAVTGATGVSIDAQYMRLGCLVFLNITGSVTASGTVTFSVPYACNAPLMHIGSRSGVAQISGGASTIAVSGLSGTVSVLLTGFYYIVAS